MGATSVCPSPSGDGFFIGIPLCSLFILSGFILKHGEALNKKKGGDSMGIDFFAREVKQIQKRFNETCGRQTVCNLDLRYAAILSICRLGILSRAIRRTTATAQEQERINEFVKIRDALNTLFDLIEKQNNERRSYVHTRKDAHATRRGQQRHGNLPQLRHQVSCPCSQGG
jgi:hypothetical protein